MALAPPLRRLETWEAAALDFCPDSSMKLSVNDICSWLSICHWQTEGSCCGYTGSTERCDVIIFILLTALCTKRHRMLTVLAHWQQRFGPSFRRTSASSLSAFWGQEESLWPGALPWTALGAPYQTPVIGSRSLLVMPPSPCPLMEKFCMGVHVQNVAG